MGRPLAAWAMASCGVLLAGSPASAETASGQAPVVDLRRVELSAEGATAPLVSGGEAELTLQPALQEAARKLLAAASPLAGAIVVASPRTGRILAWVERGGGGRLIAERRAPVASLFKIVTTAALLESGSVSPADRICTSGGLRAIERHHLDPPRGGQGQCDRFDHALGHSRNAVYAQLATRHLTRDDLILAAERFGFNAPLPFDVTASVGSVDVPYNDLHFARTAAGFESGSLTPLGALHLGCIVASGGRALRLHIVERAGDYVAPDEPELLGRVVSRQTASLLTRMMEVTVHSGTARAAFTNEDGRSYLGSIRAAAKTGTLQPGPGAPTTSWFVGFAPSRRPELVVSVLLSNGRTYRQHAKEVGRDVLRAWFAGRSGVTHPLESDW